jgi:hypothetical protein
MSVANIARGSAVSGLSSLSVEKAHGALEEEKKIVVAPIQPQPAKHDEKEWRLLLRRSPSDSRRKVRSSTARYRAVEVAPVVVEVVSVGGVVHRSDAHAIRYIV